VVGNASAALDAVVAASHSRNSTATTDLSTREEVGPEGFRFVLEGMFDENQGDAGVIFRT